MSIASRDPGAPFRRGRRLVALALFLPLTGCGNVAVSQSIHHAAGTHASQSVETRVRNLLRRMTLDEKVGQMTQISVSRLRGDCNGGSGELSRQCLQRVLIDDHVGSILSGGGEAASPNTPQAWAEMTNAIQHYALEHSRLHIPVLYGADAVHGHNNVLGATIFPHNIGMAATWDADLARQVAARTAASVRATGVHWTFSPVADIARDLRWGRYYETFGEDPYLASQMVGAEVQGYQGADLSTGVAATAKHFVGYSGAVAGQDRAPADISLRSLYETYLPSFQSAVEAGVATVMIDSGSVDGMPVHASHTLVTDVLRGDMKFDGFTVSDWGDVDALWSRYHLAKDVRDAVRMAVLAGVDMAMVPYDADGFTKNLVALVNDGQVPMARIDEAVTRILTVKFRLGLFDTPYVDVSAANRAVLRADTDLAKKAAEESMTLLQNTGALLPLRHPKSVLVTGTGARSLPRQMGGWTIGWQGVSGTGVPPGVTMYDGIKAAAPPGTAVRAIAPGNGNGFISAARSAGVVVVVASEPSYAEGPGDAQTAALDPSDAAALKAVAATGKPSVLVVVAGRPLMIADVVNHVKAAIMAWLPGSEGGAALGDVLFGKADPAGRLPISWPKRIGQAPLFYLRVPGTSGAENGGYDPLYPFGYGLQYHAVATERLQATPATGGGVTVKVTVQNSTSSATDDVIEVYDHPVSSTVLVPPERLCGFARVHLSAGETRTVTLEVPARSLSVVTGDGLESIRRSGSAGTYDIMAGAETTSVTVPSS